MDPEAVVPEEVAEAVSVLLLLVFRSGDAVPVAVGSVFRVSDALAVVDAAGFIGVLLEAVWAIVLSVLELVAGAVLTATAAVATLGFGDEAILAVLLAWCVESEAVAEAVCAVRLRCGL